jgi:hypothetical protein
MKYLKIFYYLLVFVCVIIWWYLQRFPVSETMFIDSIFIVIATWAIIKVRSIGNE